jgi:hypothetical protein
MLDQPLLAKNAEDRAHRRVRGWIGKIRHDLGNGRPRASIQDVHHLPLATGECGNARVGGGGASGVIGLLSHQSSGHGIRA